MADTALFVTCLVDQLFPQVGEATIDLLEQSGCTVAFPSAQTCCGQPLFNTGYRAEAAPLARRFIEIFEDFERVVTPSGSCASMVRVFYTDLLRDEPEWARRAEALAARTFELTEFLDRTSFSSGANLEARVVYHPSCHLKRELGVDEAPRRLLRQVRGLELIGLDDGDRCCGFGGAFSVKLPELSSAILEEKLKALENCDAQFITAADTGCLMQLGGALSRRGSGVRAVHIAELLAGRVAL